MGNEADQKKLAEVRRKLRFWQVVSIILFAVLVLSSGTSLLHGICAYAASLKADAGVPHKKEVLKIIKPLRYSGIQALMRQDVRMSMNFDNGTWILHNLYRYDSEGRVLLEEERYGLCGELSRYVYQKIKPVFGDKYNIEFIYASESGYFSNPRSSHVILRITEQAPILTGGLYEQMIYILDPSFGRYGKIDQFEDYLFWDTLEFQGIIDERQTNGIFGINGGFPIIISKDSLLSLIVEENNGKFDRDNFVMSLTASRRHTYAGRYIFALRNNEGEKQVLENKALAGTLLDKATYQKLHDKLTQIFDRLTEQTE